LSGIESAFDRSSRVTGLRKDLSSRYSILLAALKLVKKKSNLNSDNDPNQNTTLFYSEEYYLGHYGAVIEDEANYQLLSLYWRDVLFVRRSLDPNGTVLDFGSGVGQVSAALPRSVCFDFNPFALGELRKRSRVVIDDRQNIPRAAFDFVLSSHSLEHSPTPFRDLEEFRQYLRPGGRLVLVLPIEIERKPSLAPDWNRHLHAWTFQTITNLLLATGWTPLVQTTIYGPYLLRTLGRRLPPEQTVRLAYGFGRMRRAYASMLTIAKISE
jgi:SAM-dependent methyltransferase